MKGACGGLDSLKYSKLVAIGNPIRAEGRFVDLIRQADKDREDCIPPNKAVCAIRIPSTESPHAHLEKSPYGLADRTWLEACYRHYGSNSLWVGSHIDARIPELSADVLMSKAPFQARVGRAWDDRAGLPGFLRENGGLNPVTTTDGRANITALPIAFRLAKKSVLAWRCRSAFTEREWRPSDG